ncbi:3-ketoacyl-CoA thiolase [Diplonema papillatum]|nr:3-ketoacyl-CoA thiolase [Diplonema papillatum]|eukprot:gene16705-25642_t
MPFEAYIVDCLRTAGGKKNGSLKEWHPADLGAAVVDELVTRSGVPPAAVDDVIVGCVSQIGVQGGNIGRIIVLSSSVLPETVPGTTVDRQCGSSQQAIHFAAQAVMSGDQDVVIAAGVELMSKVPIGANILDGMQKGRGNPFFGKGFQRNYNKTGGDKPMMPTQFAGAELLAKKYGMTREEVDQFAAESHQKAAAATKKGIFKKEIIPVEGKHPKTGELYTFAQDEGIRPQTTVEALSKLKPLAPNGIVTAGSSSQITDAASAVMIVNERAVKKYNLKPRAKIVAMALCGADPIMMLEGPVYAGKNVLKKAGMTIGDIDIYEVNEAFGPVPVAFEKALGGDRRKMNIYGGACALGHALGSTGTRLMTTLINALENTNGRYGIQAICEGGGTANATIIERLPNSHIPPPPRSVAKL